VIVKRCNKCKKFVWWFQGQGELQLELKSGKKIKKTYCYECIIQIINKKSVNNC